MHTDAHECTQMHTDAYRCIQMHTDANRLNRRAAGARATQEGLACAATGITIIYDGAAVGEYFVDCQSKRYC
jgi:hypothetical protein